MLQSPFSRSFVETRYLPVDSARLGPNARPGVFGTRRYPPRTRLTNTDKEPMNSWICRTHRLLTLLAIAAVGAPAAWAAASGEIATIEAAGGRVTVIRLGQPHPPTPSMVLLLNDIVVTKQGRASVRFLSDGSVLRIGPDSRVQIDETAKQRDVTVFFGRVWAHVVRFKERTTRFRSSSTIAAIRGTELSIGVSVDGDDTQLSVLEGSVLAETDAGSLVLNGGQVAIGRTGTAPALNVPLRPQDAVRWALYYLPVLPSKPGEPGASDLARALDSMDGVESKDTGDAGFFTRRAALLLATGSVEQAQKDVERALAIDAADSGALALQTIMAVAANQNDRALDSGRKAVAAAPKSATAQIALSYAQQASFDLNGAQASVEAAVALEPGAALAWARLAEIRSSLGHRGESLEAARKAVDLDPNLSRTQSVLGYAYLAEVKTREAREAFGKALAFDKSDPLPWLGLGLARIREGELREGLRDIEVAVSLDPGQALVRSYLGKAYFEAKEEALVEREYELAKSLDPKDPTPRLYDAIAKQTTNRPVEALADIQEAIELNDNRGVYRSRLLLDQDLAARSAGLGRIYSDLGFQNLALVEGWNSVEADPANHSAHRLLADAYAALPRHEIARVSELLQAQMLQPLNTTPIQPSLGESNLFLISSQGAGTLSFNEFGPLFSRDQVNVQGSFQVGQDDTLAGEGILSGVLDKFSFSAGYSGFATDGFRENNSQDDRIANVFAQAELSPSTSIQAELRHRKLESGDLGLRFYEDDFSPLEAQTIDGTNARVGLRHEFSPAVTVLASYLHSDKDIDFALPDPDPEFGVDFSLTRKEKADSAEGQLLFRSPRFKVVAGAGLFDIDSLETSVLDASGLGFSDTTQSDINTRHSNLYLYSHVSLPGSLTASVGLSADLFDESGSATANTVIPDFPAGDPIPVDPVVLGNKDRVNPKLGITWRGASGTTLRAAWFQTLKRTLVTDQTLEPTQVAGFNQFFDDPSGTESEVYGAAIDQKFGRKVFAGAEYSTRKLGIPQFLFRGEDLSLELAERDGDERLARAYFFAAPHPWLTFGAELQYEDFDLDPELQFPFSMVKTRRVPLSARFFHPSGWGAFLGATHLDQEGDFRRPIDIEFLPDSRSFWVVDAALRYRLPRRYGFLVAGVNNLTDEQSTYQATDSKNLSIRPGRAIYARVVLAFP